MSLVIKNLWSLNSAPTQVLPPLKVAHKHLLITKATLSLIKSGCIRGAPPWAAGRWEDVFLTERAGKQPHSHPGHEPSLPGRSEVCRAGKRDTLRIPPWQPSRSFINEVNHEQIVQVHRTTRSAARPTSESDRGGRRRAAAGAAGKWSPGSSP